MHGRQTTNSGSLEPSGGCFRDIGLQLDTRSVKLHETVDFTSDIRTDHFDCKDENCQNRSTEAKAFDK